MRSARLAPVVALVLLFTCAACAGSEPPPKLAGAPAPKEAAGCEFLFDRVSTVAARLVAIRRDSRENAAKYHAVGDVMDKLDRDLDATFTSREITALASDYREGAKATAASTHQVAALLDQAEAALARLTTPRTGASARMLGAAKGIASRCSGSANPDCAKSVEVLRGLSGGEMSSARIEVARKELADAPITTPGLKESLADADGALGDTIEAMKVAEQIERDVRPLIAAYERSVSKLRGLNTRADVLCAKHGR